MLKKTKRRKQTDIDITPLLDVMFLLVIFFMVASSFHEETRALEVALPRAENPTIITVDEKVLTVTVTKDDRVFMDEQEVEPSKLKEELNKRVKETGFKNVIIRADSDAKYRSIVAVIDAANAVETEGISFAVLYTSL